MALFRFAGGTFTAAEAGSVERLVPHLGRAWCEALLEASAGPSPASTAPAALAVSARATAAGPAPGPEPPVTRTMVPGADGSWLLLDAAPLSGTGHLVAVTIRGAGRSEVGELLLRTYRLTNRETQVALAVLRHETNQEIAAGLSITAWTVQDHLKAIFAKTGVHARRELAVKLFRPPASRGPQRPSKGGLPP